MSIYNGVFGAYEKLASSKLNSMVAAINAHVHDDSTGTKISLSSAVSGLLPLGSYVSGILAVANGGTGSATQNWVDLSNVQSSIGGAKTFISTLTANSLTLGGNMNCANYQLTSLVLGQTSSTTAGAIWYTP